MEKRLITPLKALQNDVAKLTRTRQAVEGRVWEIDKILAQIENGERSPSLPISVIMESDALRQCFNPHEPYQTAQDEMHAWADRSVPVGVVMQAQALRQFFPDGMER
jgi:hypothetical protein